MIIKEINSKSILSVSKIYRYVINPYVGCQHGCTYCYARYMKRFTGHAEPWGDFVDVKVNAVELLQKEVHKKKKDQVWISGVCDPYQPVEATYKLTGDCLKILGENGWPIIIQTRSPLVLRDMDVIKNIQNCSVGFSIPTGDDAIRKIFEPETPAIMERINALAKLHGSGIKTYAMIAPILPGAEKIMDLLEGKVDYVYVDRMNYTHATHIYKRYKLENFLTSGYFHKIGQEIITKCKKTGINCSVFF